MNTTGSRNGNEVVIIGAGPAGLTAAFEALRWGGRPLVLEKDGIVGGLSRTERYKGFHFDMGGHRFFTKSRYVSELWHEVLGSEFLKRPRLSRIYYRGRYFSYPPQLVNTLVGLGPYESLRIIGSYLKRKLRPNDPVVSFRDWVENAFGDRLFRIFFESYTEKVWGIPCTELRAEWAAQRIRTLSMSVALKQLFWKPSESARSLIHEFEYPVLGPGMMWEAFAGRIAEGGGAVQLRSEVHLIGHDGYRITHLLTDDGNGGSEQVSGESFISSMPLTELLLKLDPPPPPEILTAVGRLSYRSYLTVCLIVDSPEVFPDNWIYIHEPEVRVARIQNYKNWSEKMVPSGNLSGLGMEYFCNEGDRFWSRSDADLVAMATREIEKTGLVEPGRVIEGVVYRVPKAYPIYDLTYAAALEEIKAYIDRFRNLRTIGRNGLHRYNNQDHSMLTGVYAVRSLLFDETHDLWSINDEQEYLEEVSRERDVPERQQASQTTGDMP